MKLLEIMFIVSLVSAIVIGYYFYYSSQEEIRIARHMFDEKPDIQNDTLIRMDFVWDPVEWIGNVTYYYERFGAVVTDGSECLGRNSRVNSESCFLHRGSSYSMWFDPPVTVGDVLTVRNLLRIVREN